MSEHTGKEADSLAMQSKKRKKNYYKTCAKRSSKHILEPGMKGFLLTCNQNEKMCVKEAYNILNEYADKLYGDERQTPAGSKSPSSDSKGNSEPSFEDELQSLKETGKTPHRFQHVKTKTKNVLFIETLVSDPCHLVHCILKDLKETKKQKCRYLFRILPVTMTCKGNLEAIEKTAEKLLDEFVQTQNIKSDDPPVPFTVIVKVRNNSSMKRDDIISVFLNIVRGKEIPWTPTLKDSKLVICVEVVQTVCCMSILKDYFNFKKYNLIEISKSPEKKSACDEQEIKDSEHN